MTSEHRVKAELLIVDDNPVNLHLLVEVLEQQEYEVRAATNGARALATARSSPPDLIMLDITMPEMNGFEVCRRLKADEQTRHIPVIFISALDEALDKVKGFEAGAVDYVTKPFQFEEIVARVENQLKIARLQRALAQKNAELVAKNEELARKSEELADAYHRAGTIFFAMSEVVPGAVLDDRYRIEEKIGSGRFGVVYRATQLGLQRPVALKILRPASGSFSAEGLDRFRSEGVATCRVSHPNAVIVLDFGVTAAGIAYLATELLTGRSLADELEATGPFSLNRCSQIVTPVCDVLAEAHAVGVFHGNLRAGSVFLHRTSGGEVIKVLDFGLATLLDTSAHEAREDVLSATAMLYEMLSGQPPADPPRPLGELRPDIPEAVDELVMRGLSPSVDRRPAVKELAQELLKAVLSARIA